MLLRKAGHKMLSWLQSGESHSKQVRPQRSFFPNQENVLFVSLSYFLDDV